MTNTPLVYNQIYNMDCLEGLRLLESDSIQMAVTSPPYWSLRTYHCDGQIGQEDTPGEYISLLRNSKTPVIAKQPSFAIN
jgi:DNA modification methylase